MEDGEENHKLNFPEDVTENQSSKRKRLEHEGMEQSKSK